MVVSAAGTAHPEPTPDPCTLSSYSSGIPTPPFKPAPTSPALPWQAGASEQWPGALPSKLYHYSAAHLRPAATSSSYARFSPSIPAAASPASGLQLASSSFVGTVSPDSRAVTPDRPARHLRRVNVVTPQSQRRVSADSTPGLGEMPPLAADATAVITAAAPSSSFRLPPATAPQLPPSISTYQHLPPSRPHGMRSMRQASSLPELHSRSSRKSSPPSRSERVGGSSVSAAGGRKAAPRPASVSSLQALRLRCCTSDPVDWNRTISQNQLFGYIIPPTRVRLAALTTAAAADASGADGPPLLELFHPFGDDEPPPLLQPPPRLRPPAAAVAAAEAAAVAAGTVEDLSEQERSRRGRAMARAERRKPVKLADRPPFKLTGSSSPLLFSEVAASRGQSRDKAQLSSSQLATLTRQEWDGPPSAGELLRILQVANVALASGVR